MKTFLWLIFLLFNCRLWAQEVTYSNTNSITIPDEATLPVEGDPYPSTIEVSGQTGSIISVKVSLYNITHAYPAAMDVLLVAPNGFSATILSDAGGPLDISDVTLTLDDKASGFLSDEERIASGSFKPTDIDDDNDNWPSPAPVASGYSSLSSFQGMNANGTWSLYVVNDDNGSPGVIAGGWSLTIESSYLALSQTVTGFTAAYEQDAHEVALRWRSDLDEGYSFLVQYSGNEKDWTTLKEVASANTGAYLLWDKTFIRGTRYYRLVILNHGYFSAYSRTVKAVMPGDKVSFNVYPNPARSVLNVYGGAEWKKGFTIELTDLSGKKMIRENIGDNNARVDISRLTNGVYFLKISADHMEHIQKLIVSH